MQCHNIKPSVRKGACGRREGNGILFNPSVEEGGEGRKKSSKLGRSRVPVGVPGGEGRTASMKVFLCRKGNKVLGSEHGAGGERRGRKQKVGEMWKVSGVIVTADGGEVTID